MKTIPLDLDGYTDLPPGLIANVVTYFEMRNPPPAASVPFPERLAVRRVEALALGDYRRLYRRIGHDWLWFSRAVMDDPTLAALLARPTTEIYFLESAGEAGNAGEALGLAELHRGEVPGEVEIAMFGVVPEMTGRGAARGLMAAVLDAAWQGDVRRVWLHTCSFDHPAAVPFYRKAGFSAFKFAVEVSRDPRLDGHLPKTAGPLVALIEPPAGPG